MAIDFSPAWFLAPLLAATVLYDLRFMRLPNVLALCFVAVFLGSAIGAAEWTDLLWPVSVALLVLLGGMAANAAGFVGGGDVKVTAALLLSVPTDQLLSFAFLLCCTTFGGIVCLLLLRRAIGRPDSAWKALRPGERYPLGVSIGSAGLILLALG
ncbi:MAG: prepilin peptidase [Pseudomonadota bacterium]